MVFKYLLFIISKKLYTSILKKYYLGVFYSAENIFLAISL